MAMHDLGRDRQDLYTFSYISDDKATSDEDWIDLALLASSATVHKIRSTPEGFARDTENRKYRALQRNPGHGHTALVLPWRFAFHFEHPPSLKRAYDANVAFDRLDVLVDQCGYTGHALEHVARLRAHGN
jgi:hypothetical protein